jgi:hypothetical protein
MDEEDQVDAAAEVVRSYLEKADLTVEKHGEAMANGMIASVERLFHTRKEQMEVLKKIIQKAEGRLSFFEFCENVVLEHD